MRNYFVIIPLKDKIKKKWNKKKVIKIKEKKKQTNSNTSSIDIKIYSK